MKIFLEMKKKLLTSSVSYPIQYKDPHFKNAQIMEWPIMEKILEKEKIAADYKYFSPFFYVSKRPFPNGHKNLELHVKGLREIQQDLLLDHAAKQGRNPAAYTDR